MKPKSTNRSRQVKIGNRQAKQSDAELEALIAERRADMPDAARHLVGVRKGLRIRNLTESQGDRRNAD